MGNQKGEKAKDGTETKRKEIKRDERRREVRRERRREGGKPGRRQRRREEKKETGKVSADFRRLASVSGRRYASEISMTSPAGWPGNRSFKCCGFTHRGAVGPEGGGAHPSPQCPESLFTSDFNRSSVTN